MNSTMYKLAEEMGRARAKTAGIGDFAGFTASVGNAVKQLGGAVKAAPAAAATGSLVPKAKNMLSGGLGWKGNALLLGGTVGAGILANKAMNRASTAMAQGPHTPVYGPGQYGYQLPYGVNEYGTPQVGTSL